MISEKQLKADIGSLVKKLRMDQGMTLHELAFKCEMESSNIARIESGGRSVQLYTLIRVCEGLNISTSDFLKKLSL